LENEMSHNQFIVDKTPSNRVFISQVTGVWDYLSAREAEDLANKILAVVRDIQPPAACMTQKRAR
jgi:hypothetical protein